VEDYVTWMRAWILPPQPERPPGPVSSLSMVTSFDYLAVVWRLRFGAPLVHVPSAERAPRLMFDATTAEEFDNRLGALGEMLKGLHFLWTSIPATRSYTISITTSQRRTSTYSRPRSPRLTSRN
jgi:hypothetical protein